MSGPLDSVRLLRPLAPEAGKLDPKVIRQAADWWARLRDGATPTERDRFERWRQAQPAHDLAWQRLGALTRGVSLGAEQAGADVASRTLQQAPLIRARRNAIRWMMAATGVGLGAWAVNDREALRKLAADLRTGTGERRSVVLADGTRVELNASSAVDLRYTDTRRELVLHEGEILVATGQDPRGRPFTVRTRAGVLTPVGTRFLVRDLGAGRVRVAVLEGAVDVANGQAGAAPRRVPAGGQAEFSAAGDFVPAALAPGVSAWLDGMLLADAMPLADFLRELGRYRPGVLRCAPEAAHLRVVGAFPVADTDQVLSMLQDVLPVRVQRYTRYWVNVHLA